MIKHGVVNTKQNMDLEEPPFKKRRLNNDHQWKHLQYQIIIHLLDFYDSTALSNSITERFGKFTIHPLESRKHHLIFNHAHYFKGVAFSSSNTPRFTSTQLRPWDKPESIHFKLTPLHRINLVLTFCDSTLDFLINSSCIETGHWNLYVYFGSQNTKVYNKLFSLTRRNKNVKIIVSGHEQDLGIEQVVQILSAVNENSNEPIFWEQIKIEVKIFEFDFATVPPTTLKILKQVVDKIEFNECSQIKNLNLFLEDNTMLQYIIFWMYECEFYQMPESYNREIYEQEIIEISERFLDIACRDWSQNTNLKTIACGSDFNPGEEHKNVVDQLTKISLKAVACILDKCSSIQEVIVLFGPNFDMSEDLITAITNHQSVRTIHFASYPNNLSCETISRFKVKAWYEN